MAKTRTCNNIKEKPSAYKSIANQSQPSRILHFQISGFILSPNTLLKCLRFIIQRITDTKVGEVSIESIKTHISEI